MVRADTFSKNNNNIARLDILPVMFPRAHIVVPLRELAEHAASLPRQHKNFLKLHAADPIIERYMRDIGHLEFGALHSRFAFPRFDPRGGSPDEANYWLDDWIAAYQDDGTICCNQTSTTLSSSARSPNGTRPSVAHNGKRNTTPSVSAHWKAIAESRCGSSRRRRAGFHARSRSLPR